MNNDLICPILLDYFVNPITLICCGKCISKEPLLIHLKNYDYCPLCKQKININDIDKLPISKNIISMIEIEKEKKKSEKEIENVKNKPKIIVSILTDEISESSVKKISIENIEEKYINNNIIIPVIDISGSMSGAPIKTIKKIMNDFINKINNKKNIISYLITYNNDYYINKLSNNDYNFNKKIINDIDANGGTSFDAAFNGINNVINYFKKNDNISIIFLTDGETSEDKNMILCKLTNSINEFKNTIIHTLGFGESHDYELLNCIRKCACNEGIYKYVSNVDDNLFSKLKCIFDVLYNEKNYNLSLEYPDNFKVLYKNENNIWTRSQDYNIKIKEYPQIDTEIINDDNNVWKEWINILIDSIGKELLEFNNLTYSEYEKEFYLEILNKRITHIKNKMDEKLIDKERINKITEIYDNITKKISIDNKKLNDLNSEGKFYIKKNDDIDNVNNNNNDSDRSFNRIRFRLEFMNDDKLIGNFYNAFHGKFNEITNENINATYKGYTPLDYAIISNGYWITIEKILSFNGISTIPGDKLLKYCIDYYYYNTGKLLINKGISLINDNLIDSCINEKFRNYMLGKKELSQVEILIRGLYDECDKITEKIKYRDIYHKFNNFGDEQNIIIGKLIEKNLFDAYEEYDNSWPLLSACENNNLDLVNILLEDKNTKNNINKKNNKGNTCLWISACYGYYEICKKLIKYGSDVNTQNMKGDSLLIIPCQKGFQNIIELMINNGIKILDNINGDNPIIICCRTNKANILKYLLEKFPDYDINKISKIDGYNALLAAVEIGSISCIKILYEFKANMNFITSEDNQIIQGGNSISVCSYCGHVPVFNELIKLGLNPYFQTTKYKFNAAHLSIKQGFINMTKLILNMYPKMINEIDYFGRIPYDYCDEKMKNELFNCKLSKYILNSSCTKIPEIIERYGESYGCYTYKNLFDFQMPENISILSYAYITNNEELINICNDNPNKNDKNGVPPIYWKNMRDKYDIKYFNPNSTIKKITQNNNYQIQPLTINIIKNNNKDLEIIEFIEKYKNKYKELFCNGKINVLIKMYKNPEENFYNLFASYLLFNEEFNKDLNENLFNWKIATQEYKIFIKYIYNMLNDAPKCEGELYLFSDIELPLKINHFMLLYTEKNEIIQKLNEKNGFIYIITAHKKVISNGNNYAVTLPGIEFKFIGKYKPLLSVIIQKNIRNSYATSDKGIIEIEEI